MTGKEFAEKNRGCRVRYVKNYYHMVDYFNQEGIIIGYSDPTAVIVHFDNSGLNFREIMENWQMFENKKGFGIEIVNLKLVPPAPSVSVLSKTSFGNKPKVNEYPHRCNCGAPGIQLFTSFECSVKCGGLKQNGT